MGHHIDRDRKKGKEQMRVERLCIPREGGREVQTEKRRSNRNNKRKAQILSRVRSLSLRLSVSLAAFLYIHFSSFPQGRPVSLHVYTSFYLQCVAAVSFRSKTTYFLSTCLKFYLLPPSSSVSSPALSFSLHGFAILSSFFLVPCPSTLLPL